jgi:predicted phosphodiesterase
VIPRGDADDKEFLRRVSRLRGKATRFPCHHVAELIRILSDIHFGDRISRVVRLEQLQPLFGGVSHLVLNGDTLDTREGPNPAHNEECRAAVVDFLPKRIRPTFLSGNHDPDFTPHHYLDLAQGSVFVIHGDLMYDDIVPWSIDGPVIGRRIAAELEKLPIPQRHDLDQRSAIFRRVAASIPQRHQSERHRLKYALRYLADTVWPPQKLFRVLRAWQTAPTRAATLAGRYRPRAKFILNGHTHRAGIWRMPSGVTVINTGSFAPPPAAR